ncbi:hypothetical protein LUZ60_005450 [Juncus effusus]|nr:hypothetical protein LUZ60_005450 [Juncus effusus]
MLSDQTSQNRGEEQEEEEFRDIHLITPPPSRRNWRQPHSSRHTSTVSVGSGVDPAILAEQLTIVNRELAMIQQGGEADANNVHDNLTDERVGEEGFEETNPLAIVADNNPIPSPRNALIEGTTNAGEEVSLPRVRKEEAESKISAWQTAEVAKINNRFKREEVVINGCETEQVEKALSKLKKIERKLDKERARAVEKTQNEVAKAHRKAEERRASAEAKRGTKIAKILDMVNFMRAVGRAPAKRSVF